MQEVNEQGLEELHRKRLRDFRQIMNMLGLSGAAFDKLGPQQIEVEVRGILDSFGRTLEARALAIPDEVMLGGQTVRIAPKTIKEAQAWRKKHVAVQRALAAAGKKVDAAKEIDRMAETMELMDLIVEKRVELLEAYLATDPHGGKLATDEHGSTRIPENATNAEIKAALEVAERQAYPFDEVRQAIKQQTQTSASSATSSN